jgi:hypothetical protein
MRHEKTAEYLSSSLSLSCLVSDVLFGLVLPRLLLVVSHLCLVLSCLSCIFVLSSLLCRVLDLSWLRLWLVFSSLSCSSLA